eukprot:scaffold36096_cov59-Attheya_sp.AAC.2
MTAVHTRSLLVPSVLQVRASGCRDNATNLPASTELASVEQVTLRIIDSNAKRSLGYCFSEVGRVVKRHEESS